MSTPPEPEQGEQGPAGVQGDPGPSAYEVWLAANPGGTLAEFWDFLKGEPGDVGPVGPTGDPGDDGLAGTPGPSVFDLWLEDNPGGTRAQFFESLRGPAGPAGPRSLPEIRTVNSDVRRIYLEGTAPVDGPQPGDLVLSTAPGVTYYTGSSTLEPQSSATVTSVHATRSLDAASGAATVTLFAHLAGTGAVAGSQNLAIARVLVADLRPRSGTFVPWTAAGASTVLQGLIQPDGLVMVKWSSAASGQIYLSASYVIPPA